MEIMMNWFLNLFKGNQDEIHTKTSELTDKIVEIQERIAVLRSSLEKAEKSNKSVASSSQPVVATPTTPAKQDAVRNNKEQEMIALKAKLLGKKL
jgi:hypothetical protein